MSNETPEISSSLREFNILPGEEALSTLLRCCGAARWAQGMLAARPFPDRKTVLAASEGTFANLTASDWLEAFRHHSKIGDIDSLRQKFAATADWASNEQAGARDAAEAVLHDLAAGNAAYEARFGFIFIICATGKSAAEMLAALRERLPNDAATELQIASGEQQNITRLRLEKLFPSQTPDMFPLSTHVLDLAQGRPAAGIAVTLETSRSGDWVPLGAAVTDADGRARFADLAPQTGDYRLTFEVAAYFAATGTPAFYPVVQIVFTLPEAKHHHVPLLLSPYGYSTYRGS